MIIIAVGNEAAKYSDLLRTLEVENYQKQLENSVSIRCNIVHRESEQQRKKMSRQ